MEEFKIKNFSVLYNKKFDGGGTSFGFNAITKENILDK